MDGWIVDCLMAGGHEKPFPGFTQPLGRGGSFQVRSIGASAVMRPCSLAAAKGARVLFSAAVPCAARKSHTNRFPHLNIKFTDRTRLDVVVVDARRYTTQLLLLSLVQKPLHVEPNGTRQVVTGRQVAALVGVP